MKKAIILLPIVLSLTGCNGENWNYSNVPSLFPVFDRGIYNYKDGEDMTVDILFYFRNATSVDFSYFPESRNDNRGYFLYVIDVKRYEDELNYVIIKDMPNRSDYYQYYSHYFKEENYTYYRTILFKIPTSFFRNDRGMFWVSSGVYNNENQRPEDRITFGSGFTLRYQKIMDNKMIEIW